MKLDGEKEKTENKIRKEKELQMTYTNTEKIDILREIEVQKAALKELDQAENQANSRKDFKKPINFLYLFSLKSNENLNFF